MIGHKKRLENDEKVVIILDAATEEYASVLGTTQIQHGSLLTPKHLRVALDTQYRIMENKNKSDDIETALTFLGACYNCGEKGHRARDCEKED